MIVLKVLTLLLAGILSFLAMKSLMREMQAVKVRARSDRQRPLQVRRLRQDPRTGVYYPE